MKGSLSLVAYGVLLTTSLLLSVLVPPLHPILHWSSDKVISIEVNSAQALSSPGNGCRVDQPTFGDLSKLENPVVVWC